MRNQPMSAEQITKVLDRVQTRLYNLEQAAYTSGETHKATMYHNFYKFFEIIFSEFDEYGR